MTASIYSKNNLMNRALGLPYFDICWTFLTRKAPVLEFIRTYYGDFVLLLLPLFWDLEYLGYTTFFWQAIDLLIFCLFLVLLVIFVCLLLRHYIFGI